MNYELMLEDIKKAITKQTKRKINLDELEKIIEVIKEVNYTESQKKERKKMNVVD